MNIEKLFIQVSQMSKHYDHIEKITGEKFNIFRTLNLESSEVRMHSAFLAEFLDPKGSHGQGDLYLQLFVEQFQNIENYKLKFDTNAANVKVEEYTGVIDTDYTKGGRIDILMKDNNNNQIIIENKIYAPDQKNQLLRYYNYDNNALLLYLTLYGENPSSESTGDLDEKQYHVISYQIDIINWLEKCKKESTSLPIIRETIVQYINLIRYLTNQTVKDAMSEEIKELILDQPDYIEAIYKCHQVLELIINETKEEFEEIFNELFHGYEIPLNNGETITVLWDEDVDGVWFGYEITEGGEHIDNVETSIPYSEKLKKIDPRFKSNKYYAGWFNPDPFGPGIKFKDLDKKKIIELYSDKEKIRNFVKNLVAQEKVVSDKLKNELEKKNLLS